MNAPVAGRKLDALIAERVMGWDRDGDRLWPPDTRRSKWKYGISVPPYSTSIADAWPVVEKLKERHSVELIGGPNDEGGCEHWSCTIKSYGYRSFQDQKWRGEADTAPLAICIAALRAVDAEAAR